MLRNRVYELLEGPPGEDRARNRVQLGIILLIVVSTLAIIVETVPSASGITPEVFHRIEVVSVLTFTVEYILRVWSSSASPRYGDGLRGRLRYMRTPYAVIDLVAILPYYLAFLPLDLRFLRMARVVRLLRLAKLARYSEALALLMRVVVARRYELGVTLFVGGILLTIASAAMYLAEHQVQPEQFSSIPATMWWAVTTLTTVGYGDLAPITTAGRLVGAVIAILGIGIFALPTGILGASFVEEMRNRSGQVGDRCPTCGKTLAESAGDQH